MAKKTIIKAAGFNEEGLIRIIDAAERGYRGLTGHPWSKKTKADMLKAVNGLKSKKEITERITAMATEAMR